MHVQSINLFRFCHSRCKCRRHWLSSLMSDSPCLRSYMMIHLDETTCVKDDSVIETDHITKNGDLASTLIMGTFEKRVHVLRASNWFLCGPSE